MNSEAVLITQPAIDFNTFLGLTREMLGYSPASSVDACRLPLSDTERYLACLAGFKEEGAPVGLSPHLLTHAAFSVLAVATERDLLDILEICGMPFVVNDTVARGIQAAIVTGTLAQWRTAVISGCQAKVETSVRHFFNKLVAVFEKHRLNVWSDCNRKPANDRTFLLLEDKRGR
jgi:hypothetical protein